MGRRKWRRLPLRSRISDRPFDCKDARSVAPFFWSPCLRQSSGRPDAVMAEKLLRQNARCHSATQRSQSSQSHNKRVRTGEARSNSCVPSCKAPASKSPRPPVAAVGGASLRRFLRSLLHSSISAVQRVIVPIANTLYSKPKRALQSGATGTPISR